MLAYVFNARSLFVSEYLIFHPMTRAVYSTEW